MIGPRKVGSSPSGGSATPGGTSGQLQYNADGEFAGVPGSDVTPSSISVYREGGDVAPNAGFNLYLGATSNEFSSEAQWAVQTESSDVGENVGSYARLAIVSNRISVPSEGLSSHASVTVKNLPDISRESETWGTLNVGKLNGTEYWMLGQGHGVGGVARGYTGDAIGTFAAEITESGADVSLKASGGAGQYAVVLASVNPESGNPYRAEITSSDGSDVASVSVEPSSVTLNAIVVLIPTLQNFADDTAARAAGLVDHQIYKSAGVIRIVEPIV